MSDLSSKDEYATRCLVAVSRPSRRCLARCGAVVDRSWGAALVWQISRAGLRKRARVMSCLYGLYMSYMVVNIESRVHMDSSAFPGLKGRVTCVFVALKPLVFSREPLKTPDSCAFRLGCIMFVRSSSHRVRVNE